MKKFLKTIPLRTLLMLLAVIATTTAASARDEEAFKIGDLFYYLDDTNLRAEVTWDNQESPSYTNLPSELTIPDTIDLDGNTYTVTSIGEFAFRGCTGLTSVRIPDSATIIGASAFSECTGMTSINIPKGITSIGNTAFYHCIGLTSIDFPSTLTSIGIYAFDGCTGLSRIVIPNSITTISEHAFNGCSGLLYIDLPESITLIETSAFNGCSSLTEVFVPASVTHIGEYVFNNCDKLKEVTCYATTPPVCDNEIVTYPVITTLIVPKASLEAYKTAEYWNRFGTFKAIEDIPTGISDLKVDMSGISVTSSYGTVTVCGLKPAATVACYDLKGVKLGEATASDGVANFSATPGSVIILHTGNSSMRIAVK